MGMAPLRLVTCIFQAIFSCSFYLRGRFFSGLVPFKSGPRHRARGPERRHQQQGGTPKLLLHGQSIADGRRLETCAFSRLGDV
jgi:hypothetical protein